MILNKMIELGMTTIDDIVYQYKDTNIDNSDKGDFDIEKE
jgi:hypothetical protein